MRSYQADEVPEYYEADEPAMWPLVVVLTAMAVSLFVVIRKERR